MFLGYLLHSIKVVNRFSYFLLLSVFGIFLDSYVHAQLVNLSGKVTDESGQSLELVTVVLLKLPDSTEIAQTLSNAEGQFYFYGLVNGSYVVVAMQIAYQKSISDRITPKSGEDLSLQLVLKSEYREGEEVMITGRRPVIRQEDDKMIVDVENTVANSGLTAVEVLRRSPGVSVNKDGIISLKGRRGVLVMLDDKPLYMSEEQVGNLLKSIPSDQIKEIEIITSPSAKYDAAGNAGIINIKLKKGAYEGLNSTVNGSYGQGVYYKTSAGIDLSYKKKKLVLNSGYQYNNKLNMESYNVNRNYRDPSSEFSRLNSDSYYKLPQETHNFNISTLYSLTEKTTVSFNLLGGYAEYGWDGGGHSVLYKQDQNVKSSYRTTDVGVYNQANVNVSFGTQHKLDTNGTVLSYDFNYNRFSGVSNKDFRMQHYDSLGQATDTPFLFLFRDPSYTNQYTVKGDFVGTLFENIKIESGLKAILMERNNPASITITERDEVRDASNFFKYREDVYALYSMLNRTLGKFKVQGGLRLEHTDVKGIQGTQDTSFVRTYTNLFPSANITYKITDKISSTMLYSRRILRPTPWQLNPVLAIVDPFTAWGGNPYLLPEYTDNVELNASFFSGYVIAALNYNHTIQPITWVLVIDSETLNTIAQPRNLEKRETMGMSVSVNMPVTKWWQTNNYVYVFNDRYVGDLGYGRTDRSILAWELKSIQAFTLSKKTTVELSGTYHSSTVYGLSKILPLGQLTLAVQQKILTNRSTLKLSISDLFWTERWTATNTLGSTDTKTAEFYDNRILMFTFSYKFGKKINLL